MAHHDQQDAAPGRNRSDRPHRSPSPARADPPPTPECLPDQASACAATPPRSRHPTHARSPTKRAHPTRQTYDSVPLRPPVTVALPVSRKPARQPTHTYERGLSPCPYRLVGADGLEVLVDEDMVRPVDADVVNLVLAVAQLHDTVHDTARVSGKRCLGRLIRCHSADDRPRPLTVVRRDLTDLL